MQMGEKRNKQISGGPWKGGGSVCLGGPHKTGRRRPGRDTGDNGRYGGSSRVKPQEKEGSKTARQAEG